MSKIDSDNLVGLALRRQVPSDLEKMYTKKTGINPVAIALRKREAKLIYTMRFIAVMAGIALAISAAVVIFDMGMTLSEAKRSAFWWAFLANQAVFLLMAIYLSMALPTYFFGRFYSEVNPFPGEVSIATEFCKDLSDFSEWGRIDPKNLEAIGFERLKRHADTILVTEAVSVLLHDKTNEDISFKYDTLLRLGLVEAGGYKKYFTKAREQLASRT